METKILKMMAMFKLSEWIFLNVVDIDGCFMVVFYFHQFPIATIKCVRNGHFDRLIVILVAVAHVQLKG